MREGILAVPLLRGPSAPLDMALKRRWGLRLCARLPDFVLLLLFRGEYASFYLLESMIWGRWEQSGPEADGTRIGGNSGPDPWGSRGSSGGAAGARVPLRGVGSRPPGGVRASWGARRRFGQFRCGR